MSRTITSEFREKMRKLASKGNYWTHFKNNHTKEANEKRSDSLKGRKLSPEHIEKMKASLKGRKSPMEGKKFSIESRRKMSESHLGQPAWNKGKHSFWMKGEKNPNWKGGISSENELIRLSLEYKGWRKKVFERDDYTCQGCETRGKYLHPHHLYSFADYPEYRFEAWNGQTLCQPCHLDLHKQLGFG